MKQPPIQWNDLSARAEGMTIYELQSAIRDIRATLPHADALDLLDEGNRGGTYRDEASVYHRELALRGRVA